jgi:hypothetical protein
MTTIPLLEAPWLDGGKWKDIALIIFKASSKKDGV